MKNLFYYFVIIARLVTIIILYRNAQPNYIFLSYYQIFFNVPFFWSKIAALREKEHLKTGLYNIKSKKWTSNSSP